MKNDLISRSAQHKHLLGPCVAKYPRSFTMGLLAAARELDSAPAVDAVEVVRCAECRYYGWEQSQSHGKTEHFCKSHKGLVVVRKDTFCSYGERRDDESPV